eukprot:symbB.v1.2.014694.t1/scaffold1076.1/size139817/5
MLDDAMGGDAEELTLDLEIEDEDEDHRAAFIACTGDYLALFRHFALAEQVHRTAGRSSWGLARCLAEQLGAEGGREEALKVALEVVLALKAPSNVFQERHCCQALFLLENLASSSAAGALEDALAEAVKTPVEFLNFLVPFVDIAAAATEALARRCLSPAPWIAGNLHLTFSLDLQASPGLQALLIHSQAFCHRRLEALVQRWRAECVLELQGLSEISSAVFSAAAALACHCHFVGYCIPLTQEETGHHFCKAGMDGVEWLLAALYQAPTMPPPEILNEVATSLDDKVLMTLIQRTWHHPQEEKKIIEVLEHFGGSTSSTPCEEFYDATVYPPWHKGVECMGVLPVPLHQHLRHLCPEWRPEVEIPTFSKPSRLLVAGCGSGHQVAVELRSFDALELVAFDVSAKTVAVAKRKLREILSPEDFARVTFLVGDIMDVSPGGHPAFASGFDLVVCCGVLHHLPNPLLGLQRLASVLKPKVGVLKLATYSTLSHRTWQSTVQDWLKKQDLLPEKGNIPTQEEVRRLRQKVLETSCEDGSSAASMLLHFPEFYTYAGLLDLVFHPLERTFTLLELLEDVIPPSRLLPLGVFFLDVNADLSARRRFREHFGDEADMGDLRQWHQLEELDPELFGRMHGILLGASGAGFLPSTVVSENDARVEVKNHLRNA